MKKLGKLALVVFCLGTLIFFSGCGVYDKMDLEKVREEVSNLKTTQFDLGRVKEILQEQNTYFGDLSEIDETHLEKYGINKEYIASENGTRLFVFEQENNTEINSTPLYSYIIAKPEEDKKDLLNEQIERYYQKLLEEYSVKEEATEEIKEHLQNIFKKEYEGYLIYILSDNNEAVWDMVEKNCHPLLFEDSTEISKEQFLEMFSLEENDIVEYQAMISNQETSSSMYLIVRPKKKSLEKVKKQIEQYMKSYESTWSTYLPEEYQLVKNRISTEVGSYFVYIISKDNNIVLSTIKNAVVKKD